MTASRPAGPTLVLGGIRSGKSAFAEKLTAGVGSDVVYLATGVAVDDDFAGRIRKHQESRPADWVTVEESLDLAVALEQALGERLGKTAVLVDSLDTWVSNLLWQQEEETARELEAMAMDKLQALLEAGCRPGVDMVLVSSETGMGLVAPTELGRRFQDLLGLVNQRAAARCSTVYLVAAGIPVTIKDER